MAQDAVASRAAEESAAHITERVTEHYERRGRELWGLARRLGASDEQAADVLKLYGRDGPDGLEGAIPVVISSSLDDRLPMDTWLSVRGHFDDAASVDCIRTYPEGWDIPNESTELQVLRCRERFVITAFETREAS